MNVQFPAGVRALEHEANTTFKLTERSLVTVYVETPTDIPVVVSIQEAGGLRKTVALSTDQDKNHQTFVM